jgi:NAD(P)-dependent dehydrogenase (short-subunit alcohol dehydrogenase family)
MRPLDARSAGGRNNKEEAMSRTVLITGASGGLGAAVVASFARAGDRLVLVGRREPELRALVDAMDLPSSRALLATADVTQDGALSGAVSEAAERFGPVEVAVHLAGGFKGGRAVETAPETWEQMLQLNLGSGFVVTRAVLPGMLERGRGKLVFVSSRGGSEPMAGAAAYGASKAGLELLVRSLAEETHGREVNVNAVAPSTIDTPANRRGRPDADFSTWVQPDSLAGVIAFLASEAARDIHGAIIPVYGRG